MSTKRLRDIVAAERDTLRGSRTNAPPLVFSPLYTQHHSQTHSHARESRHTPPACMYTIRASSLNRTTLRRPKRADRRSRASVSFAFAVSSSSRSRCASRCASCSCACAPMDTVRSAAHARATSRLRTIPRAQWWACVRACVRACTGAPRRPRGGSGGTCSVLSCVRCSSSRSAICGGK